MTRWQKIVFILIVIVGIGLRFWRLGAIPEGFHADEVAFGYNAYSLLKTGKDEHGVAFPLVLKSFGDDKPALYAYLTLPSIALFGLTEKAVRFPSAVFGLITIVAVYVCAYSLTRIQNLSILSAFIASVSPALIVQSRVQSNPIVSFALLLFVVAMYREWVRTKKMRGFWVHFFVLSPPLFVI